MKTIGRILFTICLGFFIFQLATPISYWIHYQINQEEIAEEFCENKEEPELECNGKCHLSKTLEEIKKPVSKDKEPQDSEKDYRLNRNLNWICTDNSKCCKFDLVQFEDDQIYSKENSYKFLYSSLIPHPPNV